MRRWRAEGGDPDGLAEELEYDEAGPTGKPKSVYNLISSLHPPVPTPSQRQAERFNRTLLDEWACAQPWLATCAYTGKRLPSAAGALGPRLMGRSSSGR